MNSESHILNNVHLCPTVGGCQKLSPKTVIKLIYCVHALKAFLSNVFLIENEILKKQENKLYLVRDSLLYTRGVHPNPSRLNFLGQMAPILIISYKKKI